LKKIEALEALKSDPDFLALAAAFKRIVNILKGFPGGAVDTRLFECEAEGELHRAAGELRKKAEGLILLGHYDAALREIARLRPDVDDFFNAVLVMAENEKIRRNRLSLLASISSLFREIADFSRLVTPQ
jgi:glycyl-tRNA synthetase beta chain